MQKGEALRGVCAEFAVCEGEGAQGTRVRAHEAAKPMISSRASLGLAAYALHMSQRPVTMSFPGDAVWGHGTGRGPKLLSCSMHSAELLDSPFAIAAHPRGPIPQSLPLFSP